MVSNEVDTYRRVSDLLHSWNECDPAAYGCQVDRILHSYLGHYYGRWNYILTSSDRHKLDLLLGPNGWAIYKAWKARGWDGNNFVAEGGSLA